MPTKKTKTHTSAKKKSAASSAGSTRATKKAASNRSQSAGKPKRAKKNEERPAWLKRRDELTLELFQRAYESHQRGEFRRL
jgi:hypothetical protein